jgi:hypothetical protein
MSKVLPYDVFGDSVPILREAKDGSVERSEDVQLLFPNAYIIKVKLEARWWPGKAYKSGRRDRRFL